MPTTDKQLLIDEDLFLSSSVSLFHTNVCCCQLRESFPLGKRKGATGRAKRDQDVGTFLHKHVSNSIHSPCPRAFPTHSLNRELMHLLTSPPPGISAFPANPDSLFLWSATVSGPPDSPYEGIEWKLEIKFGGSYPIKAPEVKFQKGVWHPNVDLESGAICLDILKVGRRNGCRANRLMELG